MPKILHLSDLHVGASQMAANLDIVVQRILKHPLFPAASTTILITGDLVERPFWGNHYSQASSRLKTLRQAGFRVFVIPGNHDYGMGWFNWPPFAKKFLDTFLHGRQYPLLDFVDQAESQGRTVDHTAFIGIDSNADELGFFDRFGPQGEIGDTQRKALDTILSLPRVQAARHRVLYLHHHPEDSGTWMGLKDWKPLHQIIAKHNVSAILHGHRHLAGPKGRAHTEPIPHVTRVYDAGASLGKKGYPLGPHRLIDLDQPASTDIDLKLLTDQPPQ